MKGTVEILPGWWGEDELYWAMQPGLGSPDQMPEWQAEQRQISGEVRLLREIFSSAFEDLNNIKISKKEKEEIKEWLLTDCGDITLEMCLQSFGVEDISGFRKCVKKFLTNGGFSIDKLESSD